MPLHHIRCKLRLFQFQYGKTSSMLQQGKNIGFNKMEQAATLPHNVCHFCLRNLEINHLSQHATSLTTILFRPFTTGLFFLGPMYAISEEEEAQEHMWSSASQQICREHRWRSFEKNGATQQKTSCSLYWLTRWSLRAVTVNICKYMYK